MSFPFLSFRLTFFCLLLPSCFNSTTLFSYTRRKKLDRYVYVLQMSLLKMYLCVATQEIHTINFLPLKFLPRVGDNGTWNIFLQWMEQKTLDGGKRLSQGHGSKIDSILSCSCVPGTKMLLHWAIFAALQNNIHHGARLLRCMHMKIALVLP